MTDTKPRPIRKVPEPLIFPTAARYKGQTIPYPEPEPEVASFWQHVRQLIREEITKALYAVGTYDPEPEIASMTEEQFTAFMAHVWSEE